MGRPRNGLAAARRSESSMERPRPRTGLAATNTFGDTLRPRMTLGVLTLTPYSAWHGEQGGCRVAGQCARVGNALRGAQRSGGDRRGGRARPVPGEDHLD